MKVGQLNLKISLITATRNSLDTIHDSIRSVATQKYGNIELIWIDGASTDGTREFLASKYLPEKGKFLSEPDKGIYDALNKGILISTGDIIGFMHADDFFADEDTLSYIAESFSDPLVMGVYGDLMYVESKATSVSVRNWKAGKFEKRKLSFGWMPPHPTLYLRREIFDQIGSFNTEYKISADYDFMLRLFNSLTGKITYIPKTFVKMRVGGASNKSIINIIIKSYEDLIIIKANKIGGVGVLLCKNLRKINQFWNLSN